MSKVVTEIGGVNANKTYTYDDPSAVVACLTSICIRRFRSKKEFDIKTEKDQAQIFSVNVGNDTVPFAKVVDTSPQPDHDW